MGIEDYKVLSFWSFNEKMEHEEVRNQIRDFKNCGYGGFFMHARAGLEIEYMSKEWFDVCRVAIYEAQKQQLSVWLYDENGWPSGFADGKVPAYGDDFVAKHICFSNVAPNNKADIIGAYKKQGEGYISVKPDSSDADLFCIVARLKGYADLLNFDAVSNFIKHTHEVYKRELGEYFGTTVKGIFTDEPQLVGKYPYTYSFPQKYMEKYNESFIDNAWMLQSDLPETTAFKYKVCKLFGEMFTQSFTCQIEEWCAKNNLIFTGHFSNEDGLCNQVKANFNLMEHYKKMSRPGIDFLGRRLTSLVLLKQVADSAFLHNKNIITSESFGCAGWDVTFDDLSLISSYQAAFGVNSIVTHLSAYSMKGRRKRDYPAFYSYQEPWWDTFYNLADNIAQNNGFLAEGKRKPTTLVIHPTTSMWCLTGGSTTFSEKSQEISNQFRILNENLIDLQRDYLLISEDDFMQLKCENQKLYFNDNCFDTVIIPYSVSLNASTYKILKEFSNGKNVCFINQKPYMCEGQKTDFINDIFGVVIQNRKAFIDKFFLSLNLTPLTQIVSGYGGKIASGVILTSYFNKTEERICVLNTSYTDKKDVYIKTKGNKSVVLISGKNETVLNAVFDGKYTYSEFVLEPKQSSFFKIVDFVSNKKVSEKSQYRQLNDFSVKLTDLNALNIDMCDVYLNDELFIQNANIINETDKIYETAFSKKESTKVSLFYKFSVDFKNGIPSEIYGVFESESLDKITVNNNDLNIDVDDWWVDKSFKRYDIKDFIINGENNVVLEFTIIPPEELAENGDFEGYKNKFFYPIEPESIYVLGEFDVKTNGMIYETPEFYTVDGDFYLSDLTVKNSIEFTKQNLWFYRGNYELNTSFDAKCDEVYTLKFDNSHFTCADVFVNGIKCESIFKAPLETKLNNIIDGKNDLRIVIYGSNRNLLGPHHHIKGNPHFLGVDTFKGNKTWTDLIYPDINGNSTYTEKYSFVKYKVGSIKLLKQTR